ncbi:MAG: Hemolysin, partial [Pseudomonadota bacterium]
GVVAVLASGSVLDLGTDTSAQDVSAGKLLLTAGTAIGAAGNPLETSVATLTTKSTTGATYVTEADAVSVDEVSLTINRVDAQGAAAANTPLVQKGIASGTDLVLRVVNGSLMTVAAKGEVTAAGNILLQAAQTASATDASMTLNALVNSTGGNISLSAADGISLAAAGDITTQAAGKTIDVLAGAGITMADGALLGSTNGNVRVEAQAGDVRLSDITAGTAVATVLVKGGNLDFAGGQVSADVVSLALQPVNRGTALAPDWQGGYVLDSDEQMETVTIDGVQVTRPATSAPRIDIDARRIIIDNNWAALESVGNLVLLDISQFSNGNNNSSVGLGAFEFAATGSNNPAGAIEYALAASKNTRTLELSATQGDRGIRLGAINGPAAADRAQMGNTGLVVTGDRITFESAVVADQIVLNIGPVTDPTQPSGYEGNRAKGLLVLNGKLKATGEGGIVYAERQFDIQVPSVFRLEQNPVTLHYQFGGPALGDATLSQEADKRFITREGVRQELPAGATLNLRSGERLLGTADAFSGVRVIGDGQVVLSGISGNAVDLSQINTTGTRSLNIQSSVILASATQLGGFTLTVAPRQVLTLSAQQADSRNISGLGDVVVRALNADAPNVNLSSVAVSGARVLEVGAGGALSGAAVLGSFGMRLVGGTSGVPASFTLPASVISGRPLQSADNSVGTLSITAVGSAAHDLGRVQLGAGVSGQVLISGAVDLSTLYAGKRIDLGNLPIALAADANLTLTAEQASSRTIDEAAGVSGGTARVTVIGLDDGIYDLDAVRPNGSFMVDLAAGIAQVTLNAQTKLGQTSQSASAAAAQLRIGAGQTLSLTADQAHGRSVIDINEASPGKVIITGLGGHAVDLRGVTAGASAADRTVLLTATVEALSSQTKLGDTFVAVPTGRSLAVDAGAAQQIGTATFNGGGTLKVVGNLSLLSQAEAQARFASVRTATVDLTAVNMTGVSTALVLPSTSLFVLSPAQVATVDIVGSAQNNTLVIDLASVTAGGTTPTIKLRNVFLNGGSDRVTFRFGANDTGARVILDSSSVLNLGEGTDVFESRGGTVDLSQLPSLSGRIEGVERVLVNSAIDMSIGVFRDLLANGALQGGGQLRISGSITQPLNLSNISFAPGGVTVPTLHFVDGKVADFASGGLVTLPGSNTPVVIKYGAGTGQTVGGFSNSTVAIPQDADLTVFTGEQLAGVAQRGAAETSRVKSLTLGANLTLTGSVDFASLFTHSQFRFNTGGYTITVPGGNTLTLTAAQADASAIAGQGQLMIEGLPAYLAAATQAVDFSHISAPMTANISGGGTVTLPALSSLPAGSALGALGFAVASGTTLSLPVDLAEGRSISGQGSVLLTGLGAAATGPVAVNLQGLIAASASATLVNNLALTPGSSLGELDLAVNGAYTVTLSATQASGRAITGAQASVVLTGLNGEVVDLSQIGTQTTGAVGSFTAQISRDTVLHPGSNLGSKLAIQINDGRTLSLTADHAHARSITGAGAVKVTDLGASTVSLAGIAVTGSRVAVIDASTVLNGATNLGSFSLSLEPDANSLASGITLGLTAAQSKSGTAARIIQGQGYVSLSGNPAGADLSATATGIRIASGTVDFTNADATSPQAGLTLGDSAIRVDAGATLKLTASQASGRVITGDGSLVIVGIGPVSPTTVDFSAISVAQASAMITSNIALYGSLGKVVLTVKQGNTLTIGLDTAYGATVAGRTIITTGPATPDLTRLTGIPDREFKENLGLTSDTNSPDLSQLIELRMPDRTYTFMPSEINHTINVMPGARSNVAGNPNYSLAANTLHLDSALLGNINVKDIVVGNQSGNHVINIRNDEANPVVFTVPLTINADGASGRVNIVGTLQVTDFTIRGSGQSTYLVNGADIDAEGNVNIVDRVVVSGTNEISVGPNKNITITGNVQEQDFGAADSATDVLVLTAQGGDVTINGSVSLDQLMMSGVDDAVITGDLTVEKASTLNVKNKFEVKGKVILLAGATLEINAAGGAPQIIFGGGLEISDGTGPTDRVVINGARETIFTKVLGTSTVADHLLIRDAQQVVIEDRDANVWIGISDDVNSTPVLLSAATGDALVSAQGATLSFNANRVDLGASVAAHGFEFLPRNGTDIEGITLGLSGSGFRTLTAGAAGMTASATQFTTLDGVGLSLNAANLSINTSTGARSVDLGDSVVLANGADLLITGATSIGLDHVIKSGAGNASIENLRLTSVGATASPSLAIDLFPTTGAQTLSLSGGGTVNLAARSGSPAVIRDMQMQGDGSLAFADAAIVSLAGTVGVNAAQAISLGTSAQVTGGNLELVATQAITLGKLATISGTAGTLTIRATGAAQPISLGTKFAGDANTLRVTAAEGSAAAGNFSVIDGFSRILVGGTTQTGSISVGDERGVSFNDSLEIQFADAGAARTASIAGTVAGVSLRTVNASELNLADASISMTGLLSIPVATRLSGNTLLQAGTIDLAAT